jgi:hypothetical protein
VGAEVGVFVSPSEVGVKVGNSIKVGTSEVYFVGAAVGAAVGLAVGMEVGAAEGAVVGAAVGLAVGMKVGAAVGVVVGAAVGLAVGASVGACSANTRAKRSKRVSTLVMIVGCGSVAVGLFVSNN